MSRILLIYILFSLLECRNLMAEPSELRYSQIVVPFSGKRVFDYKFNDAENSLQLELIDTRPEELEPLYNYDSRIVRRIIVKELSNHSSLVKIVLKDRNIQVAVYSFNEPYRLVIDMYDRALKEKKDPQTGLPYLVSPSATDMPKKFVMGGAGGGLFIKPSTILPSKKFTRDIKKSINKNELKRRRLLQPKPAEINNSQELLDTLQQIPPGAGPQWKRNPAYIYKLSTDTLKVGKSYNAWLRKNAKSALGSSNSLANYAAKMMDFGHEMRALVIYRKLLYEDPQVFEKEAKHLWNLAEIHFGSRNLTLAEGYYRGVMDKFPDHPLSKYASMRILDINYLRAYESSSVPKVRALVDHLNKIHVGKDRELEAQILIRKVYWGAAQSEIKRMMSYKYLIPNASDVMKPELKKLVEMAENPKTAFILSTILAFKLLENDYWNDEASDHVTRYLKRFRGNKAEPYRADILKKSLKNISLKVKKLSDKNKDIEVVLLIESLDPVLKLGDNEYDVLWSIAVAYRNTHRPDEAYIYFEKSRLISENKTTKFRAQINKVYVLKKSLNLSRAENNDSQTQKMKKKLRSDDEVLRQDWLNLTDGQKAIMAMAFKEYLVENLEDELSSKVMNEILLWSWDRSLNKKLSKEKIPDDWQESFQVSGQTVVQLSKLSRELQKEGDTKGFRSSKELIKEIDPDLIQLKEDQKLWADELSELAESYRETNEYLSAGRTYAHTGLKSKNWDQRAEALYKGGLLLYRSGRREEAIQAFEAAANDGNNLLYAQLAEKRLEQLNQ